MGERETCAACGLPRATRDDLAALAPECRRHAGCSACDGVRLCWHDRADHCAETRGGWPAIVAAARAEAERLTTERDQLYCAVNEDSDRFDKLATALGVTDYVCSIGPLLAEAERLRTAAADERADVIAALADRAARARSYPRTDLGDGVADALDDMADAIESGAHVGAAKRGGK